MSYEHTKEELGGQVLSDEQLRIRLAEASQIRAQIDAQLEDDPSQKTDLIGAPSETEQPEEEWQKAVRTYLAYGILVSPDGWLANRHGDDMDAVQRFADTIANTLGIGEYCRDEECEESKAEDDANGVDHSAEHNEDSHHGDEYDGHTHAHRHAPDMREAFSGQQYQGGDGSISIQLQSNMVVTDTRRWRSGSRYHEGTDMGVAGNRIGTPLEAVEDGRVVHTGTATGYGNVAIVSHGHGVYSMYAHLDSFIAQEGEIVRKGQEFVRMGNTGIGTGPHLHLEIALRDEATGRLVTVDPQLAEGRDLTDPNVRRELINDAYSEARSKVGFNLAGHTHDHPEFHA